MANRNFFAELKRRNVYKVAVAYAVVGWLLVQVTTQVFPIFEIPNWAVRLVVLAIVVGFPIALVIAWAFELTPRRIEAHGRCRSCARKRTGNRTHGFTSSSLARRSQLVCFLSVATAPEARSTGGIISEPAAKSIAVLPFVNMSADKNDEYLSDGMTEELLNVLTKVKGLRVPGRSSSFAFKGKNEEDIFRKVGEQLHVNTVLEGSVRKAGDKLRITAQLINVADGFHLWSETYDGDMKDILAVQSDVAKRVVAGIAGTARRRRSARAWRRSRPRIRKPTGFTCWAVIISPSSREPVGPTRSITLNRRCKSIPTYALAYCGLADTYGWAGGQTLPGREAWAKEMEFARKALALDPNLAEAHLSHGNSSL